VVTREGVAVSAAALRALIEPLMTAEEVAESLHCSESLVYKLRREGNLKSVRVGSLLRFRPDDVRAYVNGGEP